MEDRKEYILKHAAKVFSEKGYQLASLQDIAKKAKLSKAGVYHYFKSKEEILAHILISHSDKFTAELLSAIKASREKKLTPKATFQDLIENYAELVNRDRDRRLIVLRERHQLTRKYKKELIKREQAMFHIIKDELGNLRGLRQNIDLNVITFLFISMSHWLGYWYKEGKGLDLQSVIDQNINVIFHGMFNGNDGCK
jgi:TetR/AcrR family transcriptional regulator, cholesterol catabolism regulator